MKFHEFVESAEPVTKGGIFDPLLICDNIVVKRFETGYGVYEEVTVAWDLAHGVVKKSDLHDLRQSCQRLQVLPL